MKKSVMLVGLSAALATPSFAATEGAFVQSFTATADLLNTIVYKSVAAGGSALDVAGSSEETTVSFTGAVSTTVDRELYVCIASNKANEIGTFTVSMASNYAATAYSALQSGSELTATSTTDMVFYDSGNIAYDIVGIDQITADVTIDSSSQFALTIPGDDTASPYNIANTASGVMNLTGMSNADYLTLSNTDEGTNKCDFKKVLTIGIDEGLKWPNKNLKGHIKLAGSLE